MAGITFGHAPEVIGASQDVLIPIRSVLALYDPAALYQFTDLKACVDSAAQAKEDQRLDDINLILLNHVELDKGAKKAMEHIRMYLNATIAHTPEYESLLEVAKKAVNQVDVETIFKTLNRYLELNQLMCPESTMHLRKALYVWGDHLSRPQYLNVVIGDQASSDSQKHASLTSLSELTKVFEPIFPELALSFRRMATRCSSTLDTLTSNMEAKAIETVLTAATASGV